MSNPSPNRPRNLFGNNTNPSNIYETITPPTNTGVEPSPTAVPDRENVASIPPIEERLASPQHMDHPFKYLIDAAFAAQFQPTKDTIFNRTHVYAEYQYQQRHSPFDFI